MNTKTYKNQMNNETIELTALQARLHKDSAFLVEIKKQPADEQQWGQNNDFTWGGRQAR